MTHNRERVYSIDYKNIFFSRIKSFLGLEKKEKKDFFIYHFLTANKPWNSHRPDRLLFYKYLYSVHEVTPPKKFISEIIEENKLQLPIWWKIFMRFFS